MRTTDAISPCFTFEFVSLGLAYLFNVLDFVSCMKLDSVDYANTQVSSIVLGLSINSIVFPMLIFTTFLPNSIMAMLAFEID